ncbi:MAG: putative oxidoreductase C-terminal domain-containing protein [Phycisphaerales bacterium JB038]
MLARTLLLSSIISSLGIVAACAPSAPQEEVVLMTLDPGHFHAALVQKSMYEGVAPEVHVYAPDGADVQDHLNRIQGFNTRAENPTSWTEQVYTGPDYLDRLLRERPGNVVVISGNNRHKARYIEACAEAGLHVLSDKPMCIDGKGFDRLQRAFEAAQRNGVLVYDIMTERSEITTILQKELVHARPVFGNLLQGSADNPAIVKESVHHFFKYVSGKPLKRPAWYFDTTQQGEGIVDVTTHLVDLVMWEAFPEQTIIPERDIRIIRAKRWPTMITREQYGNVTRLEDFPTYLRPKLTDEGVLPCYANGEINYALKNIHTRVSVTWAYQAPEGGGDTHYSIMRGSRASIIIRQGPEQDYRPALYVEPAPGVRHGSLQRALAETVAGLQTKYPGIGLEDLGSAWRITIPDELRVGHEAHFAQVMQRFLEYRRVGELPAWETPNMLAKYHTTTSALEKATTP